MSWAGDPPSIDGGDFGRSPQMPRSRLRALGVRGAQFSCCPNAKVWMRVVRVLRVNSDSPFEKAGYDERTRLWSLATQAVKPSGRVCPFSIWPGTTRRTSLNVAQFHFNFPYPTRFPHGR
jgi:hypothetical protein